MLPGLQRLSACVVLKSVVDAKPDYLKSAGHAAVTMLPEMLEAEEDSLICGRKRTSAKDRRAPSDRHPSRPSLFIHRSPRYLVRRVINASVPARQ